MSQRNCLNILVPPENARIGSSNTSHNAHSGLDYLFDSEASTSDSDSSGEDDDNVQLGVKLQENEACTENAFEASQTEEGLSLSQYGMPTLAYSLDIEVDITNPLNKETVSNNTNENIFLNPTGSSSDWSMTNNLRQQPSAVQTNNSQKGNTNVDESENNNQTSELIQTMQECLQVIFGKPVPMDQSTDSPRNIPNSRPPWRSFFEAIQYWQQILIKVNLDHLPEVVYDASLSVYVRQMCGSIHFSNSSLL
jgi:hypothetical protein